MSTVFESASAQQTKEFGSRLAGLLKPGAVLLLEGELGAGKTCFTQGLVAGLGSPAEVSSPTFTLVNEYEGGRLKVFHIDLYRLSGPDEAARLGLEEYFDAGGVSVLEWPERLGEFPPEGAIRVLFAHMGGDKRRIQAMGI